jgi:alpha-beta hydrolase superfamily lysophospholipase
MKLKRFAAVSTAMLVGVLALAYYLLSRTDAEVEDWHRVILKEEFTAAKASEVTSLEDYLALEERLFRELDEALCPRADGFDTISRYHPENPANPGFCRQVVNFNWNRTYTGNDLVREYPQLAQDRPDPEQGGAAGAALLLHGLSDSPYSLTSVARLLYASGFDVVGLRLPGHGTLPSGIEVATVEDWRAAVRLAAGRVAEMAGPSGEMIMVGYSAGAALALDYTIEALEGQQLRRPDRLVMVSPALAAPAAAQYAIWLTRISRLPGLDHLAWASTLPEYDPYKYNSFPAAAGAQYLSLTDTVEERMSRLEKEEPDLLLGLPPVLAIQSTVDATVPPKPSLSRLFDRLKFNQSELILFDANRVAYIEALLKKEAHETIQWLKQNDYRPFSTTVVTNEGSNQADVYARTWPARAPGDDPSREPEEVVQPLGLRWPPGTYSLSHVAIPFSPRDRVYGVEGNQLAPPFPLGNLELRGERLLLRISLDLVSRMRYNPFHDYLLKRVQDFVADVPEGRPVGGDEGKVADSDGTAAVFQKAR